MSTARLCDLAQVNPPCPAFERLGPEDPVAFLPMENVWPDRLSFDERTKAQVEVGYTRFEPGDVLIPKIAPTFGHGRSSIATGLTTAAGAGTTELHVLRPRPGVEARWLFYVTKAAPFLQEGEATQYGVAGQKRIDFEWFRTYRVPAFTPEEQRRIVEYLDTETARIDDLISEQDHLVGLAQERAGAEREQLFLAHDPEARPLASFLAQAPTYGVLVPRFEDEGVPFVRVGNITGVEEGVLPNRFIGHAQSDEYRRTVLRADDVLVSVVGSLAHSAVVPPGLAGANVARAVCVLRPLPGVPSSLLAEFVRTRIYQDQAQLATGTDTAQPTLNMGDLARFRTPIPAAPDQRAELATRLQAISAEGRKLVDELRLSRGLLREHRQALITAAVTGGLDAVREGV